MTCPLQDRGAGKEAHIPSAMISWDDGEKLRALLNTGSHIARLFAWE